MDMSDLNNRSALLRNRIYILCFRTNSKALSLSSDDRNYPSTSYKRGGTDTDRPPARYPPFPPVPPGVEILPFKSFKEHGIQIFSSTNVEIDGLGIPTVPLRVPHATDQRKTQPKDKPADNQTANYKQEAMNRKAKLKEEAKLKMDPLSKAQEQRRLRIMLFARKEWYNVWAEGEDLRGIRTYDTSRSPIDRIHLAATEFRTGRIWPPASTQVPYLWDQFRLFAGLLGSPPIWIRTDQPQAEDSDEYDDESDSDVELPEAIRGKKKPAKQSDSDEPDSLEDSDDEFSDSPPRRFNSALPKTRWTSMKKHDNQINQIGSASLLALPTRCIIWTPFPSPPTSRSATPQPLRSRRETRLLKFLADPDYSVRVFLSCQGPPESERALKKASEVAKKAILELPSIWGKRWEEPKWDFSLTAGAVPVSADNTEETQEEAMKRFEEELKAANVEILSADPVKLGVPSTDLDIISEVPDEEASDIVKLGSSRLSRKSQPRQLPQIWTGKRLILLNRITVGFQVERTSIVDQIEPAKAHTTDQPNWAIAPSDEAEPPPATLDWSTPTGNANPSDVEAAKNAWSYPEAQPLMELFGMTVFPMKYELGVAERSMRRVKAVLKPGEIDRERKLRGVEEDLANRLSRVILTPWIGWEEGGVAPEYRSPKYTSNPDQAQQWRSRSLDPEQGHKSHSEKYAHDPEHDDITVLMEPGLADMVAVGMGMAGTWDEEGVGDEEWSRPPRVAAAEDENGAEDGSAPAQPLRTAAGGGHSVEGVADGVVLQRGRIGRWAAEGVHFLERHLTLQDLEEALELDAEED
ncbi:hypothetical protein BJ912DRAFT_1036725 [Pholiota molesta]|nr:hypothetical protein BJ912DRAFT_1036725 [Pholiota molesta]